MKKILLAVDYKNLDMVSLDFACYLARLTKSKLTGVFLENLVEDITPVLKRKPALKYIDWEIDESSEEFQDKEKMTEKNISLFKEACERRSVRSNIHRDRGIPASEVIRESRYADLIVVDAETSFNKSYEGCPTEFIKDILKEAECPVIIAPESFDAVEEIVFTYNGSKSSAFAIKQFTYLFPQLADKRAIILQVNKPGESPDSDKYNFKEWLQNNYSAVGFQVFEGDTDDKLFDFLFKRKNTFIVMGAYSRGAVSLFFKRSAADLLIKTVTQPIFISHY